MISTSSTAAVRKLLRNAPTATTSTIHRCGFSSSSSAVATRRLRQNPSSSRRSSSSSITITRRAYSSSESQPPSPPPPPPPRKNNSNQTVKFWPFAVIILLGFGSYAALVNKRIEMPATESAPAGLPAPAGPTPAFSPASVTVVFVLGGPGAGKGTQCARLVSEYGFAHLSAGDLLRAEQDRPGSQFGELIRTCIKNGDIVPQEVTIALLENAMREVVDKNKTGAKFLIDGFPRKMDQALKFEEVVCPARCVLFFDCPEAEMERRLLDRGKTSGRADDNADSIRKRFRTFVNTSMPVVDHYERQGKVIRVDATPAPEAVFRDTQKKLGETLGDAL